MRDGRRNSHGACPEVEGRIRSHHILGAGHGEAFRNNRRRHRGERASQGDHRTRHGGGGRAGYPSNSLRLARADGGASCNRRIGCHTTHAWAVRAGASDAGDGAGVGSARREVMAEGAGGTIWRDGDEGLARSHRRSAEDAGLDHGRGAGDSGQRRSRPGTRDRGVVARGRALGGVVRAW